MTHDEKSVDRMLKSLQPPRFENPAHQALLRERIAASAADSPDSGKVEIWKMITGRFQSKWRWAVASLALVAVVFWGVAGNGSSKAFAQALRKLREAQKMSCLTTIKTGGTTTLSVELAFKAPSIIRKVQGKDTVAIVDMAAGKGIALFPGMKRYLEMRVDLISSQTAGMDNLITAVRSLPADATKKLGLKNIRGKVAQGFSSGSGMGTVETWVDPVTGDPIQIDIMMDKKSGTSLSMTDIKLDPPLGDELFSLKPPAGFTALTTPDDKTPPTEQDLVGLLRFWAEYSPSKQFPDSLDPLSIASKVQGFAASLKNLTLEERIKIGLTIQRSMFFLIKMDPHAEWQYTGQGLGLKDGDQPVFWWRPNLSTKYRVITASLQIKELEEKDFPSLALYRNEDVRISEAKSWQSGNWFNLGEMDAHGASRDTLIGMSGYGGDWTENRLPASDARYDVRIKLPKGRESQLYPVLRKALEGYFGYATRLETRPADVYVLTAPQGRTAALADPAKTPGSSVGGEHPVKFKNLDLQSLVSTLRAKLGAPVFDETGIKGKFDYTFEPGSSRDPQALAAALRGQLKLELKPARRNIKFLVIEPASPKAKRP